MNYPAYFRKKKQEARCFRTDEHPDYYERDDDEPINPDEEPDHEGGVNS